MSKNNFKQIDLLRNRRDENLLLQPYFIDTKKFINRGIYLGLSLIIISLSIGASFIIRTNILEQKKFNIKKFSEEYDLLVLKSDKDSKQLKKLAEFNQKLRNSISSIISSSAFIKEISLLVPKDMQLISLSLDGDNLNLKGEIINNKPIELVNAFLIRLDDSEFINFSAIDLTNIKSIEEDIEDFEDQAIEDKTFEINIKSTISDNYLNINQKYLIKLGSLGLSNRIKNLNNIFESTK